MRRSRKCAAVAASALLGASMLMSPAMVAATTVDVQGAGQSDTPSSIHNKVVGAYFADWDVYNGYYAKDIPASRLNTIWYAFAAPTAKGTCGLLDPQADYQMRFTADQTVNGLADKPSDRVDGDFKQLMELKARHPGLKVLISLGGWTDSTYFSDVAATAATRKTFVDSCIDLFMKGNLNDPNLPNDGRAAIKGLFDGIDIDWEYPTVDPGNGAHYSVNDMANAMRLFTDFQRALDRLGQANGRHYMLTAALPATSVVSSYFDLKGITRSLDFIDLMTYDFHGTWDSYAALNSPFTLDPNDPAASDPTASTVGTVRYFLTQGVKRSQLVVGVPFYGNEYDNTPPTDHGLYQPYDDTNLANSQPDYHILVDVLKILRPDGKASQGFTRYWDAAAGEPYLYAPDMATIGVPGSAAKGVFISYEDQSSIRERAWLARELGLRGVFSWEISSDSNDAALTRAMGWGLLR